MLLHRQQAQRGHAEVLKCAMDGRMGQAGDSCRAGPGTPGGIVKPLDVQPVDHRLRCQRVGAAGDVAAAADHASARACSGVVAAGPCRAAARGRRRCRRAGLKGPTDFLRA